MLQEPKEHEAHAKCFGRRALHEKVAFELGANLQKQNRHGIRNSHNKDKTEYLNDASTIFSVKGNCDRSKVKYVYFRVGIIFCALKYSTRHYQSIYQSPQEMSMGDSRRQWPRRKI